MSQGAPETTGAPADAEPMEFDVVQSVEECHRSDSISEPTPEKSAQDEEITGYDQRKLGASASSRDDHTLQTQTELLVHTPDGLPVSNDAAAQQTHASSGGMAPPTTTPTSEKKATYFQENTEDDSEHPSPAASSSDRKRERTVTPMPDGFSPSPKKPKKRHRRRTNPAYNRSPESSLPRYRYISPRQSNEFVRTPSAMSHRAYTPSRASTPAASRSSTPAHWSMGTDGTLENDLFAESPLHGMTTYTSMPLEHTRKVPSEVDGQIKDEPRSGRYL